MSAAKPFAQTRGQEDDGFPVAYAIRSIAMVVFAMLFGMLLGALADPAEDAVPFFASEFNPAPAQAGADQETAKPR
jgi:hypothetical protein